MFAAVIILLLVFFFKDTLPFILGGVAALILRWAYNRWIARGMSMNRLLHIVLYIWQLPQNLLGLLSLAFLHPCKIVRTEDYAVVRTSRKMRGGISLGHYVFLSLYQCTGITINHELGHCRQSMMLGPLYLLVIGLPSIIWAWLGDRIAPDRSYYWFYTERWADRLGGVERMEYY